MAQVGQALPIMSPDNLKLTDEKWQSALSREIARLRKARKTCRHSKYQDFKKHGRCCPSCGIIVVDFGD